MFVSLDRFPPGWTLPEGRGDDAPIRIHHLVCVQLTYIRQAARALKTGGHVVMGAFDANGGPERCSGLLVQRWTPEGLADAFRPFGFELVATDHEVHTTPAGKTQKFVYVTLKKNV